MARLHTRFRDARGRFAKNDGKRKLRIQVWEGNRVKYSAPSIKRHRIIPLEAVPKERKQVRYKTTHRAKLSGRRVSDFLTDERVLRRTKGGRLRIKATFKDSTGRKQSFVKTFQLVSPKTTKQASKLNRNHIIHTLIAEFMRFGVRVSPKKFRTGIMQRTPTAENVYLEIQGETNVKRAKRNRPKSGRS